MDSMHNSTKKPPVISLRNGPQKVELEKGSGTGTGSPVPRRNTFALAT